MVSSMVEQDTSGQLPWWVWLTIIVVGVTIKILWDNHKGKDQ